MFHFLSAELVSLHLAVGKWRTVIRLCKAQHFQILPFALTHLTDTQVACRLDLQGLIDINIQQFCCAVNNYVHCKIPVSFAAKFRASTGMTGAIMVTERSRSDRTWLIRLRSATAIQFSVIVGRAYVIVGRDPTISVLQYANPKVPFSHIFSLVHICHAFCHHHDDGLQLRQ